jgi:hypothetical protein
MQKNMAARIVLIILLLVLPQASIHAQKKKPPRESLATLEKRESEGRAKVIQIAAEYKQSLEALLALQEKDVKSAEERFAKSKAFFDQSILSKRELEKDEQLLQAARLNAEETRKKIKETDTLVSEVRAEEQLARMPKPRRNAYLATAALIRYSGAGRWSIVEAGKVQSFFAARFGRSLPVSAYGQTAVHDRLGFDHRNSVDVAVHPDSVEGQALISYLRSMGIPFLAFRHAVPGSATGAHIHIGPPSHRIVR